MTGYEHEFCNGYIFSLYICQYSELILLLTEILFLYRLIYILTEYFDMKSIYDSRQRLKFVFIFTAILIAIASLVVSDMLIKDLAQEERQKNPESGIPEDAF